jgi:hypothetical protein
LAEAPELGTCLLKLLNWTRPTTSLVVGLVQFNSLRELPEGEWHSLAMACPYSYMARMQVLEGADQPHLMSTHESK